MSHRGLAARTMQWLAALVVVVSAGCATTRGTEYSSADSAVDALIAALRANDQERLHQILGPGSDAILSSGDAVADRSNVETFLAAYDERHRLAPDPDGGMTLFVGATDWPLPIPLMQDGAKWYFDAEAGRDEIVARRIGRNELDAMQVCLAIVDAEHEYALSDLDGNGLPQYADRLLSDPGRKNGLYWPAKAGEPQSPLGEFVADAAEEGYTRPRDPGELRPYHGYLYHLLRSQGSNAPGGAREYMVDGKMLGGFALVAYPAEYGNSGIMTFLVSHDGVVYERDLGDNTGKRALEMKSFDPGPEWKRCEPPTASK